MLGFYILKYGFEELKKKYFLGIISGDFICFIGIIEFGVGLDVVNI